MTERKEGFWWVRIGDAWECALLERRAVYSAGSDRGYRLEDVEEWGPYLGTEPQPATYASHRTEAIEVVKARVTAALGRMIMDDPKLNADFIACVTSATKPVEDDVTRPLMVILAEDEDD